MKEKKKKTQKTKYCPFEGTVKRVLNGEKIGSSKIRCPTCNKQIEASIQPYMDQVLLVIKKHRRNK